MEKSKGVSIEAIRSDGVTGTLFVSGSQVKISPFSSGLSVIGHNYSTFTN